MNKSTSTIIRLMPSTTLVTSSAEDRHRRTSNTHNTHRAQQQHQQQQGYRVKYVKKEEAAKIKSKATKSQGKPASKTAVVVKSKPAPTNWVQKPKAKANAQVNASPPRGAMNSSARPPDAERVSHVLEVLNMTVGDYQLQHSLKQKEDSNEIYQEQLRALKETCAS